MATQKAIRLGKSASTPKLGVSGSVQIDNAGMLSSLLPSEIDIYERKVTGSDLKVSYFEFDDGYLDFIHNSEGQFICIQQVINCELRNIITSGSIFFTLKNQNYLIKIESSKVWIGESSLELLSKENLENYGGVL